MRRLLGVRYPLAPMRSTRVTTLLLALGLTASCSTPPAPQASAVAAAPESTEPPLRELRRTHVTRVFFEADRAPAPTPPAGVLELVQYQAPLGANRAYVTPVQAGPRRPAIVWIHGGMDFGLEADLWEVSERENDQSARAFREAGIVQMYPSFRGSHDNPGRAECFFGEVEDAIAAAEFLARRADVDPTRIYVGGHSTGGTLALLIAESSDRFRGVIALGPVEDVRGYDACLSMHAPNAEMLVRAPIEFVSEIRTPTFIVEGIEMGNSESASAIHMARGSAPVTLVLVAGTDHISVVAPATEVAAQAILADTGATSALAITEAAIRARL